MPQRKKHPPSELTGLPGAYIVASEALRENPGPFVRSLVDMLLGELQDPRCTWFNGGKACGEPGRVFDGERALCPYHTGEVLKARADRRARERKIQENARRARRRAEARAEREGEG